MFAKAVASNPVNDANFQQSRSSNRIPTAHESPVDPNKPSLHCPVILATSVEMKREGKQPHKI